MKKVSAVCMVALFFTLGTMALAHRAGKDGGEGETPIYVAPSTIVIGAPCPNVTIHTEISYGSVEGVTAAVNGELLTKVGTFADSRGNLVIRLSFDEVVALVGDASEATFEVEITTTSVKYGEETVPVKP